ncbi:MAG: diguanylate cyclase [Polyangiaceae bacterium]|nr:diguanylate cyclase [Polyangiaceae bacterium]
MRIDITLGDGVTSAPAVAQLVKLGELAHGHVAVHIQGAGAVAGVVVAHDDRSTRIEPPDLALGVEAALTRSLEDVLPKDALLRGALRVASDLARADALRAATDAMLSAPTVESALASFLAGVTSPSALGFGRAALFAFDRAKGSFVGMLALGPATEGEAKRVYAKLEAEGPTSAPMFTNVAPAPALTERIRGIELTRGDRADEVSEVLSGARALQRRADPLRSAALKQLDPASEFVLAKVAVKQQVLGILFADCRFQNASIGAERVTALERFIAEAAVVWHALRLQREVEDLARYDALTGLANRREFEARLAHERSRSRRTKDPLTVLCLDVDELRGMNSERRREIGDTLLRRVGALLREELRAHDLAARFDGGELGVVLPGAGGLEAASVARRLGLAAHRRGWPLSIGAACFPDDTDHPDDLVTLATKNLGIAKAEGGGCACLSEGGQPLVFAQEDDG